MEATRIPEEVAKCLECELGMPQDYAIHLSVSFEHNMTHIHIVVVQ